MKDNQSQEKYKCHHANCSKKMCPSWSLLYTPLQLLFDKTQLFGKFGPATQFQCFIVISFALCHYFNIPALGWWWFWAKMMKIISLWPRALDNLWYLWLVLDQGLSMTLFLKEFKCSSWLFPTKKEKNGPNRQFPFQCKWQRPPFAISAPGRKQYFLSIRLNLFLTIFKADFKSISNNI